MLLRPGCETNMLRIEQNGGNFCLFRRDQTGFWNRYQESDAGLDGGVFAFRCRLLSRRADCLPQTRAPKAYPPVRDGLKQSLLGLRQRLSKTSTSAVSLQPSSAAAKN